MKKNAQTAIVVSLEKVKFDQNDIAL